MADDLSVTRRRFKSKIDAWLLVPLVAFMVFEVVIVARAALENPDPRQGAVLVFASLLFVGFIGWLLMGTHYTVESGVLRVVSGPFRWKIPVDQITSVTPTRSPLSSPALSLDRLRIEYGDKRRILVSPADKAGFARAIGREIGE